MSGRRRVKTRRWAREQARDPWVRRARAEGRPSRSAFKLEEIADGHHLLHEGQRVLELGAAPGGWTRVALAAVGPRGRVVTVDRLPLKIPGTAIVITGDVADRQVQAAALTALGGPADVVLSDLAPNLTGIKDVDASQALKWVEVAAEVASRSLKRGGTFLVKVLDGPHSADLAKRLRRDYRRVRHIKPAASRSRSSEFYLLAQGLRRGAGRDAQEEAGL